MKEMGEEEAEEGGEREGQVPYIPVAARSYARINKSEGQIVVCPVLVHVLFSLH